MGDLGQRVDDRRDLAESLLRHLHGAQGEGAAQRHRVVHRAEAREDAILAQPCDPLDQLVLTNFQSGGDLGERPVDDRETALERVDDPAIGFAQHGPDGAS